MQTQTETPEKFIKKQTQLNKALDKVKARLTFYSENTTGNCDFPDWNNWHDLQDRIEDRLKNNYVNFLSWHFEEFQFIAI